MDYGKKYEGRPVIRLRYSKLKNSIIGFLHSTVGPIENDCANPLFGLLLSLSQFILTHLHPTINNMVLC